MALDISFACKVYKKIGKRHQIQDGDAQGKLLTPTCNTLWYNKVRVCYREAHDKLSDLHGGDVLFTGWMDTDAGQCIIGVHDGMNKRVEGGKDPNGCAAVTDVGPHGDHGACMVVGLE